MKKQSRTVPRRRQSVSPTPRHLPLVDILIDTQAELGAGRRVWPEGTRSHAGRGSGRRLWATVCASTCAPGVIERGIRRVRSCWAGGRWRPSAPCAARRQEVPLPTARAFANADPLNRRVVDQMLIGVATRQYARSLEPLGADVTNGARARVRSVDALSRRLRRSWMRGGRRRSTRWTWWGC